MNLTEDEKVRAAAMVANWYWQPVEGHAWRYKYAVKTLTRYYEYVPVSADSLRLVLGYLKEQTITGKIDLLGKQVDLGEGWKAKDAWYQTAASDSWEGTKSDKVRVYQTLALSLEEGSGDGPYTVEDGCQYKVEHKFFWNQEALPELAQSTSGVQHVMQGVTRDGETGLWSCVIETRTRVQQDVALYGQSGTIFETVSEEQHLGVKAGDIDATGQAASAGGGTIVTRRITKNADCTSDVQNTVTVENEVKNSTVVYEKTLRATRTTTTNRNQESPLTGDGLAVGERRESAKTDGGRYNNQTTVTTVAKAAKITSECAKTVYEHVHSETDVVTARPTSDDAAAPNAENGTWERKTVRQNDDGSFDVTTQVTTEKPVESSVVETRKTLTGTTVTTISRNQEESLEMTGLAVGETRRSEVTQSGRYNNQTTVAGAEAAGVTMHSCAKSKTEHADTTVTNQLEDDSGCESDPGENKTVRKVVRRNELGSYDVEVTETEFFEHGDEATAGSSAVEVTVEAKINAENLPDPGQGGQNVVNRLSFTPNGNGSYSYTKTTETYSEVSAEGGSSYATEDVEVETTRHATTVPTAGENKEVSAEPDDNGAFNVRVTSVTPKPVDSGWKEWNSTTVTSRGTYTYHHGLRVFRNLEEPPTPPKGSNVSLSLSINKFGLYDGSMSYTDLVSWAESGGGGSGEGGSETGVFNFKEFKTDATGRRFSRVGTIPTISYSGSGNEGSERNSRANAYSYPGVSLPSRTYATGFPTFVNWTAE